MSRDPSAGLVVELSDMCGITGIVHFDGSPVQREALAHMTASILHRGPDSCGHWLDGAVGLGHRRLSVIDLSHAADQPMVSERGSEVIVFNGEIYNYKELARELANAGMPCRTHSDTEVILNLYRRYGINCLRFLRGMFAFAIWDLAQERLFVARDRVGIKPFYYLHSGTAFVFGSEIKAIAASGYSDMRVSVEALSGYTRFLVVPQPETIFLDIKKLEPGHFMVIGSDGHVRKEWYWSSSGAGGDSAIDADEVWISRLTETLQDSVACHMVSDVPVGAFLSGGLDSSAVVSLMREHAPQQDINAFSIGFPGFHDFDESRYASDVARLKCLNFHTRTIDENFLADVETMAWHLDEPFAVSSAYATFYLARSAAEENKVVLTGDGGDELFAGYRGYLNDTYLSNTLNAGVFSLAYQFAARTVGRVGHFAGSKRLLAGLRRRGGSEGLRYSEQTAQSSLLAASLVFTPEVFGDLLRGWDRNNMAYRYDHAPPDSDRLQKKLYAEFNTRLVDEMLMKVDRMTMAHSLEARVPLLDHRVVEMVSLLPSVMKLRRGPQGNVLKYVLKKAMESYLPEEIIYRRKQGFNIPVHEWLRGRVLDEVTQVLRDGRLLQWGVIDPRGLERVVGRSRAGSRHFDNMLMLLLAFEMWLKAYESRVGRVSFR